MIINQMLHLKQQTKTIAKYNHDLIYLMQHAQHQNSHSQPQAFCPYSLTRNHASLLMQ